VGAGSVGTRRYILLLVGRDDTDPLFLQVKEAQASVLEPLVRPSIFKHLDGVVRDYYVRQLQDWKGGAVDENLRPAGAEVYARACGATLARAHARWGDRVAIAAYLGRSDAFDGAVAAFAARYAEQNEQDFEALARVVRAGRLPAVTGVCPVRDTARRPRAGRS
jgi:uncharacterized protein DUF2252